MDRKEDLEEQVRRLTQIVEEMRGRMARMEPGPETLNRSDRRGFLRLGAGAVLGALGMAAAKVVPASAATGGTMMLGQANLAENPTTLQADGGTPPTQVLAVEASATTFAGTFNGPLQALGPDGGLGLTAADVEGVDGWASGARAAGVYGLTDSGYGVIGESDTGIALYARRSGRLRQEALLAAGNPSYIPNFHEQVRDATGVLWINNAVVVPPLGDPKPVWRRMNTLRVDSSDGTGGPFAPFRLHDTRGGSKPGANSTTHVAVTGQGVGASHIPNDAIAVFGNLTATQYSGGGFLTISPDGISAATSTVNFIVGQSAIANSFIVGLNGGKLQVHVSNNTACHFIVDINGYIQ
jgi:hypothetical protein